MMNTNKKTSKGFIQAIIIILIALALLKIVFNFNIFDFLQIPIIKETIAYIWNIIKIVWDKALSPIFWFAWDNGRAAFILSWKNILILTDKIGNIIGMIRG